MWSQLNDPERGCFADIPGLSNDSTIEISANRKYEIKTKCSRDREYAKMMDRVVAERSRFLNREAFHCSRNISEAYENARTTERLVKWRYWYWLEYVAVGIVMVGAILFGAWFWHLTAPLKVDDEICLAQPKTAWYGSCDVDICYSPEQTPWYGFCTYEEDNFTPAPLMVLDDGRVDPDYFRDFPSEPNYYYHQAADPNHEDNPVALADQWHEDILLPMMVAVMTVIICVLSIQVLHECFKPTVNYHDPDEDDDDEE
jgi:hypothetical protein